jgi:hypothetical protein
MNAIVVIPFAGEQKRICKIIPLADGGFAIAPPSHHANAGSLFKTPRIFKIGSFEFGEGDIIPFTASDKVKLSYHSDGFVQFSKGGSSDIISGIDRATGLGRGMHVFTDRLNKISYPWPSVTIGVWGLEDFKTNSPRKGEQILAFDESDYFIDEKNPISGLAGVSGFEVSFIVRTTEQMNRMKPDFTSGEMVTMTPNAPGLTPANEFRARLFKVNESIAILTIATRMIYSFGSPSGFRLGGPSDGTHNINACYPQLELEGQSLDYIK